MKNNFLVVIAGPTAVGKTSLTIRLATHFKSIILSADSRQFFKEISIGTAKPSAEELQKVPHFFINSHSVFEEYNVGMYEQDAISLLKNNFSDTQKIIFLTGGSGLYIDAVCNGFDEVPEKNNVIRKKLQNELDEKGITYLQSQLEKIDPDYFQQMDTANPQRLIRALEVCLSTGKTYSSFRKKKKKERDFKIVKIALNIPRNELYQRIDKRVNEMMENGLKEEVKKMYPHKNINALQTVGYKEIFEAIENKISMQEAVDLIKQNSRRYAKRQLTWFRKDKEYQWFSPDEEEKIIQYIKNKISE
ncbi:MAG: tRNA (adenosine(37)-N6)-dimethylallyltransferase MiaA [Bacteroidia bacterium]